MGISLCTMTGLSTTCEERQLRNLHSFSALSKPSTCCGQQRACHQRVQDCNCETSRRMTVLLVHTDQDVEHRWWWWWCGWACVCRTQLIKRCQTPRDKSRGSPPPCSRPDDEGSRPCTCVQCAKNNKQGASTTQRGQPESVVTQSTKCGALRITGLPVRSATRSLK